MAKIDVEKLTRLVEQLGWQNEVQGSIEIKHFLVALLSTLTNLFVLHGLLLAWLLNDHKKRLISYCVKARRYRLNTSQRVMLKKIMPCLKILIPVT